MSAERTRKDPQDGTWSSYGEEIQLAQIAEKIGFWDVFVQVYGRLVFEKKRERAKADTEAELRASCRRFACGQSAQQATWEANRSKYDEAEVATWLALLKHEALAVGLWDHKWTGLYVLKALVHVAFGCDGFDIVELGVLRRLDLSLRALIATVRGPLGATTSHCERSSRQCAGLSAQPRRCRLPCAASRTQV
jgi:hypothetical protein